MKTQSVEKDFVIDYLLPILPAVFFGGIIGIGLKSLGFGILAIIGFYFLLKLLSK